MTIFESKAIIKRPVEQVYSFLADMNNHRQLMPDNITGWSSTIDEVSFNIQNMANISLKITSRQPTLEIAMGPSGTPPFDMELKWLLQQAGDETEAHFIIAAKLNMMLKMFASGPLQELADHEVQALTAILN